MGLYERTPAAPSVLSQLCESLGTGWGTEGRAGGPDPGLCPEGLNYHPSPWVAFGLANCSMKWAPGTVQTSQKQAAHC